MIESGDVSNLNNAFENKITNKVEVNLKMFAVRVENWINYKVSSRDIITLKGS